MGLGFVPNWPRESVTSNQGALKSTKMWRWGRISGSPSRVPAGTRMMPRSTVRTGAPHTVQNVRRYPGAFCALVPRRFLRAIARRPIRIPPPQIPVRLGRPSRWLPCSASNDRNQRRSEYPLIERTAPHRQLPFISSASSQAALGTIAAIRLPRSFCRQNNSNRRILDGCVEGKRNARGDRIGRAWRRLTGEQ
jgi:hypothetical protein